MTTPVLPWGATVAGVRELIPDATIYEDGALPPGRRGVTESQVRVWLAGLTGRASIVLDGWERLSAVVEEGASVSDRDRFLAAARDVVHNGAASYVEAARYPEQQGKATSSYAAVLWDRYTAALTELGTWLTNRLNPPTTGGTTTDPTTGLPRVADVVDWHFPPPSFTAGLRF